MDHLCFSDGKEKPTSHAAQSLFAREKAQAGLHSEFIGLGAGGGKDLGGDGFPQHIPLNVRAKTFTSNASDTLNDWAVEGGDSSGSPSADCVGTGCADLFGEGSEPTTNLDRLIECGFLFHVDILARKTSFAS